MLACHDRLIRCRISPRPDVPMIVPVLMLASRPMIVRAAQQAAPSLQRALDALDPRAAPRVVLTHTPANARLRSLAVLDSSFNPPTRAHVHMLRTAAEAFGLESKLLLLASTNADKTLAGQTSLLDRLQMMRLVAEDDADGSAPR